MQPILEETIYLDLPPLADPTTGASADADAPPTAKVYEEGSDTPILTPTVVKRAGTTGEYYAAVAVTAANGFEDGRSYNVIASATVGGVSAKARLATFQARSAVKATLVATGLDAISTTAPIGVAATFREMVVQTWRRYFKRVVLDKTTGQLKTYADNASTVLTTQSVTSTTDTETQTTAT